MSTATSTKDGPKIKVLWGAKAFELTPTEAGLTVEEIRQRASNLTTAPNKGIEGIPLVEGKPVHKDTVIRPGASVEFVRETGLMG